MDEADRLHALLEAWRTRLEGFKAEGDTGDHVTVLELCIEELDEVARPSRLPVKLASWRDRLFRAEPAPTPERVALSDGAADEREQLELDAAQWKAKATYEQDRAQILARRNEELLAECRQVGRERDEYRARWERQARRS